jgi:hypothetical protein
LDAGLGAKLNSAATSQSETSQTDLVAPFAFLVAVSEFTLGAWLHAMRLPLAGHLLSWNQLFILSAGVRHTRQKSGTHSLPLQSSLVGAGVKALAPVGKRLTPMLAIACQGFLLNCGTWLVGRNPVGLTVGAALFSTWSLIQPVLLSYWIFGATWWNAMEELVSKLSASLASIGLVLTFSWSELLVSALIINAIVCVVVAQLGYLIDTGGLARYTHWIESRGSKSAKPLAAAAASSPWKLAFKDLLRPMFLFSFALSVTFLLGMSSSHVQIATGLCRFLVIGYLTFWALRAVPLASWIQRKILQDQEKGKSTSSILTLLGQTLRRLGQ